MLAGCTPTGGTAITTTTTAETTPSGTPATAPVVLDGDSLRVAAGGGEVEVRLLGINAPERGECWADEARRALETAVAGQTLTIVGEERDQFDRLLAYVYAGPSNVNRQLIIEGHALTVATNHDQLPDFLAAEEEAVALERGLWSPTVCGSTGEGSGVRIWAIEPDAPGRDDRNPNGEFVAIANEGAAIDLTGWMLRDESSTHRFTFPEGFVLGTGEIVTVRSGCGEDAPPELYWCADGTVWTNSGDTVLLLDAAGAVVDRLRYLGD